MSFPPKEKLPGKQPPGKIKFLDFLTPSKSKPVASVQSEKQLPTISKLFHLNIAQDKKSTPGPDNKTQPLNEMDSKLERHYFSKNHSLSTKLTEQVIPSPKP